MMHEIKILTEEELEAYQKEKRRKKFLEELDTLSKPVSKKGFSLKEIEKPKPVEDKEDIDDTELSLSSYMKQPKEIDPEAWEDFVDELRENNLSPIDSIADENMLGFQLYEEDVTIENKYKNVFKKELAMLSEVLKDVKSHGTRVNSELKKMSNGRKNAGYAKNYSDMIEAYNSINSTKLQVIKAMTDLKAKEMDWRFKDKSTETGAGESVENIVDAYYKKIIGGSTKEYVQSSMQNIQPANFEYDHIMDNAISNEPLNNTDTSSIDTTAMVTGFNITQPINAGSYQSMQEVLHDDLGYISNENKQYEVCVYQYGDNNFEFVALDENGEILDGIELPSDEDPSIVHNLSIRPGSDYVYDKYGRKYRSIEMNGVDISDIDDMEYPY